MKNIDIVFITDKNYFNHMLVAIESILNYTQSKVNFVVVLDDDFEEKLDDYKNKFETKFSNCMITFIRIDKTLNNSKFSAKAHVSKAAFIKIYLPDIFYDKEKIIYLDSDLLVVDDIEKLWDSYDSNLEKSIAAVWNPGYKDDNKAMMIPEDSETFNSGVMILNLKKMRKDSASNKLVEFLSERNHLTRLNDQAAFNSVFFNDWQELPIRWNMQYKFFLEPRKKYNLTKSEFIKNSAEPGIIHFTTGSKPWQYRNAHPYKKLYQKFYKQIFGAVFFDDKSFSSFLKRQKESFTILAIKVMNFF